MTPEQRIAQLEAQVADLMAYVAARKTQQLTDPVDDTSRLALRVLTDSGFGSSPVSQMITIGAVPTTITVPIVPDGSVILEASVGRIAIPYFNV